MVMFNTLNLGHQRTRLELLRLFRVKFKLINLKVSNEKWTETTLLVSQERKTPLNA